ncbi:D-methionine transport system substrate-binding protein [Lysinibacillus sp. RC79]
MFMKKYISAFLLLSLAIFLVACGNSDSDSSSSDNKKTIKVGTSPGPYSELFLKAVKPILEDKGYKVEDTEFTDLRQADVALADGGIDLNVDQHTAYMNNFNKESGSSLVSLSAVPTVPAALFPGKKKSLDDVKKGDVIGIPQDPSNAARAYAILQKAGWIKIKEGIDPIQVTAQDIVENKYELEIKEMESAQIPRTLEDLDYGVIPGSIVYSSGIDAKKAILQEDVVKNYELVAVIAEKNKDTDWAKAVKDAYNSQEFKKYMDDNNKDNYWFIPKND